MFYDCSNLTYIDISNFTFKTTVKLFDKLPDEGKIKINENYADNVYMIPENWEKNYSQY